VLGTGAREQKVFIIGKSLPPGIGKSRGRVVNLVEGFIESEVPGFGTYLGNQRKVFRIKSSTSAADYLSNSPQCTSKVV
jgi:hypothetical protein